MLNIVLPCFLDISLGNWKYMFTQKIVHKVHKNQLETTQMFNDWQKDSKVQYIYPHNGLLFGNKKEQSADTTIWMNLKEVIMSKTSQKQKATYCMIPLTWSICIRQTDEDREQIGSCQGLRGRRIGSDYCKDEKARELDSDGSCPILWLHLMPLNLYFKVDKIANFVLCVFYHNKITYLLNCLFTI
jgi:hypothetical protein